MTKMKIVWIQGRWQGSTRNTMDWYMQAARASVTPNSVVVFPELCHTPYFPIAEDMNDFDMALSADDPLFMEISLLAKEMRSVVVFPYFEKRGVGIYHNSVVVFETDGSIAGHYRKSHIPDDPGFYEKYYFQPGDTGIHPIQTSLGSLGILICWDQWFPEAARLMALQGADVLIYPTAIGWDKNEPESLYDVQKNSWQISMQGHAVANGIFVAAVNRCGEEGQLRFWGSSFLANPMGIITDQSSVDEDGATTVNIDTKMMEMQRRGWPFFRDRRTDLYKGLLKQWID